MLEGERMGNSRKREGMGEDRVMTAAPIILHLPDLSITIALYLQY